MAAHGADADDRNDRIIHAYVVRRRTQLEIGTEFGMSQQGVSEIISNYKKQLQPIDVEGMRRELMEIYVDTLRRTAELEALEGAPVTAGKDGDIVRDPADGGIVRDYGGRLAAHKVRLDATDRVRKMLGLDAAEKIETTQYVRYELIGVDPDDLT